MKSVLLTLSVLVITQQEPLSQELVASVQPTTFINIEGYQLINDSITRYFLTSENSKFTTNDLTLIVDFNYQSEEFKTYGLQDTQQYGITAANDLFVQPLPDGQSLIGSNGFDCDITTTDLLFLEKDATAAWEPLWNEALAGEFINSIGLVEKDVLVVNTDHLPIYFNFQGNQVFYDLDPQAYYNMVKIGDYYYGTNEYWIYKLNSDFEEMDSLPGDSVSFFQQVDVDKFLVSTSKGIAIVDTNLTEIASTSSVKNLISGAASGENFWVLDDEALYLLNADLTMKEKIFAEPRESMKQISVFNDTAFVSSEYDGINHRDIVMRKYIKETESAFMNVSIESIQMPDNIIREIWNGLPYAFTLRFDSLGIVVFNHSVDTIHSLNINVDWSSEIWCLSYHRQWDFDELEILPQQMATIQLEPFITDVMYYGAPPQFCFWVDFANEQPDIYPENNLQCGDAEIINKTGDPVHNNDVLIFPNPADDLITVTSQSGELIESVNIYNNQGLLIYSMNGSSVSMVLPVDSLAPGLYLLGIQTGENTILYEKLIRK